MQNSKDILHINNNHNAVTFFSGDPLNQNIRRLSFHRQIINIENKFFL